MPMKYEGLATVTVLALYADSPVELTTMELPILLKNVGVYRAGLEFDRYLHDLVRATLAHRTDLKWT